MLIYASSCPVYYAAHGEAFVRSAAKHGYQVKVDISDGPNDYAVPKWKAAALRFLNLPELLDTNERVLVLDIDSIITGEIPVQDDWDMALFFRPWIPEENKKLLLAASYWTPRAKPFAEHMRAQYHKKSKWLSEQTYAWRTYQAIGDQFNIGRLDQNFVSYDFRHNAAIWTAKGPSRKHDPRYLERRAEYVAA